MKDHFRKFIHHERPVLNWLRKSLMPANGCCIAVITLLIAWDCSVSVAGWSSDPMINNPICAAPNTQEFPRLVSDGMGGAIIVWTDLRGDGFDSDIYAQRINSSGEVQWSANGNAVCTALNVQDSSQIVTDGAGGAIICWEDSRNGSDPNSLDFDIYAQRIDSSGTVQWTTDGVAITTATGLQFLPYIASDGAGGAIITWTDNPTYSPTDTSIRAQRIDAKGKVLWMEGGVAVCTAPNRQLVTQMISDGALGAIVTWYEGRFDLLPLS